MTLDVKECLKELRLPAVRAACYEELAEQARRNGFSYRQYLGELLARERGERQQNRIDRLLGASELLCRSYCQYLAVCGSVIG